MKKKTLDYEVVEVCPHCDEENVYPENTIEKGNYIAICQNCGRKIFLCDECLNADDNEGQDCDWHKEGNCSVCMRGCYEQIYNNNQEDCPKKYSLSLIGYRHDDTVTDFDQIIEDLDSLLIAKETYYRAIEMYKNGENDPFANAPDDVAYVVLQIEEGYETDDGFFTTDIIEEETIYRKEENDNG